MKTGGSSVICQRKTSYTFLESYVVLIDWSWLFRKRVIFLCTFFDILILIILTTSALNNCLPDIWKYIKNFWKIVIIWNCLTHQNVHNYFQWAPIFLKLQKRVGQVMTCHQLIAKKLHQTVAKKPLHIWNCQNQFRVQTFFWEVEPKYPNTCYTHTSSIHSFKLSKEKAVIGNQH